VIGPGGCDGTITCQTTRGGVFYSNLSTTFQDYGFYELGSDPDLAGSQYGYYGLDTLALDDGVSEPEQIIAIINTTDSLLGQLGLGVQQTRLNGSENVLPFLSSLVQNDSFIPSHSYGYTAGASYRLKGVPASLALGGVDANRFTPNGMSFTLSPDYAPVVAINSISVSSGAEILPPNWNSNPIELMDNSQAENFVIDSSTPFLWLPEAVCENFAQTLNLTYDNTLQLYVFGDNNSSPEILAGWELTFNFALGNLPGAENNIEISLPYDTFNLQLSFPYRNLDAEFGSPPTNYFPIRKAADNTQFIIGRAFLQETYLTVDYGRNNFSISQAVFTEEAVSNVVLYAITRSDDSVFPGPSVDGSGLSTGAKAGIGVGVGLSVVVVAVVVWFCCMKRKSGFDAEAMSEKPRRRSIFSRWTRSSGSNTTVSELLGDKRHPTEVPADATTSRFELAGSSPLEMPAAEVSPTFFQERDGHTGQALRNNPRRPVELANSRGLGKEAEAALGAAGSDRSGSPVPPYSPSELQQRFSSSISPNSLRHSQVFGTPSSGEQGISPVGNSSGNSPHSQRDSGNLSSPISPEATMPRFFNQRTENGTTGSLSPHSSTGPFLSPHAVGRAPSRSPSRGSRFVEEGLSETSTSDRAQTPQPSVTQSARFSWEQ
jgi:Eukaryotic aspartyl protease